MIASICSVRAWISLLFPPPPASELLSHPLSALKPNQPPNRTPPRITVSSLVMEMFSALAYLLATI